jgi:di/tricarboxylate transporter
VKSQPQVRKTKTVPTIHIKKVGKIIFLSFIFGGVTGVCILSEFCYTRHMPRKKNVLSKLTLRLVLEVAMVLAALFAIFLAGDVTSVFIIITVALYFFTTEALPVDMTALLVMLLVILSGIVTTQEGFSGFSSPATIAVLCMFILSAGVEKTGVINKLGGMISKYAKNSYSKQISFIAVLIAPVSGFLNNTAAVAIFLPMIVQMSAKLRTAATKLLIPLSFLAMMGGTLTLIGTSTNILASETLAQSGFEPLGMFEFTHIGVVVLLIGIVYFLTIGRFLLPSRGAEAQKDKLLPDHFLSSVKINKGSRLIGKTVKSLHFESKFGLKVLKLVRGRTSYVKGLSDREFAEGDVLIVSGDEQSVINFDGAKKGTLVPLDSFDRRMPNGKIVKVMIKSANFLHRKTLGSVNFWKRYSVSVIGIHREDVDPGHVSNMTLKNGEVLLVRTSGVNLKKLRKSKDFMVLEEVEDAYDESKTLVAVGIVGVVVVLAALNILPIAVAALVGVLLMFVTKCLNPDEVYDAVNWDVIFLLAGVIPLGLALQNSGGADIIADAVVKSSEFLSPLLLLMVFYLITTLLTEIISNNAAVVLLIPIGLSVADKLELNPTAFVLAVMFAASTSFLTPVGYQTNTMIYGAGNYKFSDFIKVGAPLNLILLVVTTLLISHFFGLQV